MIHTSEFEAWKHLNDTDPFSAKEPRNVRLGLCTDGFQPFSQSRPVIVIPYNLPRNMYERGLYILNNHCFRAKQSQT